MTTDNDTLAPCSDAHCILAENDRREMVTHGGCQHLKERGPQLTKLLKAMGAEIVRLHSLPVLRTCGECRWCHPSEVCMHPKAHAENEIDGCALPPPSWCPLRGGVLAKLAPAASRSSSSKREQAEVEVYEQADKWAREWREREAQVRADERSKSLLEAATRIDEDALETDSAVIRIEDEGGDATHRRGIAFGRRAAAERCRQLARAERR